MGDEPDRSQKAPSGWVTAVGSEDVLLGRGKRSYNHMGNLRFRDLVIQYAAKYQSSQSKPVRKALALEIMKTVESRGGKFLKPVDSDKANQGALAGRWVIVPKHSVRTKVKQALRDMPSQDLPARETNLGGKEANQSAAPLGYQNMHVKPSAVSQLHAPQPSAISLPCFPLIEAKVSGRPSSVEAPDLNHASRTTFLQQQVAQSPTMPGDGALQLLSQQRQAEHSIGILGLPFGGPNFTAEAQNSILVARLLVESRRREEQLTQALQYQNAMRQVHHPNLEALRRLTALRNCIDSGALLSAPLVPGPVGGESDSKSPDCTGFISQHEEESSQANSIRDDGATTNGRNRRCNSNAN